MQISLIQLNIVWAQPSDNIKKADTLIDSLPETDLIILPEMFSTGFITLPNGIAEREDCETLRWMVQKAKERNAAIAGSIAIESKGHFYNRLYFVEPDGKITHYDKRHLFSYSGEDKSFTPGNKRVIVTFRGVRILLQICYDLRFPVFSRNKGDYDMMLYVASWPTSRVKQWLALLRARAIENQCYVAAVDRVGKDPSCEYCGGTLLLDPFGETITECPMNAETTATGKIDLDTLNAYHKRFPAINDADKFTIE
ncbi:MAG: amidohydrolase [Phocaeicola sp.]|uniref:amidohydrolase n=1 Tax=Phocaeicola TaxID=909656 RepID=UPI00234E8D0B|nr:amidohydrolase [Phocaeicola oris]MCE2616459.1 amidohydrolase [Phocaeicola oris]